MSLGIRLPRLAKNLTCSFESGLVDLAIALYDVDWMSGAVGESGDLPCALVPANHSGMTVEGFDKDDGLVGGPCKAIVMPCCPLHPCSKLADPLFVQ